MAAWVWTFNILADYTLLFQTIFWKKLAYIAFQLDITLDHGMKTEVKYAFAHM